MFYFPDYIIYAVIPKKWRLRNYLIARKRVRIIRKNKKKIPPYLKDNDFIIELNYKLWVTKGARFKASERCGELDRRSAKLVGWLSAYMIMFSVLPLCGLENYILSPNLSSFISISISIMILVFSQLEYAKNYAAKSKEYHDCALSISELYDELRYLKSSNKEDIEKQSLFDEARKISKEYENILQKYDNHLPIDYQMFQTEKPEYFELSKWTIILFYVRYFMYIRFVKILCIYVLPLAYIALVLSLNIRH